ncbi:hypothetical protein ACF1GW_30770 [Streptomyces achromogenes]|uniref:hypothetical protein n=1 Tax=Streptomyces achromogenes TaxID=67255 RepID=UPI003700CAD0
MIREYTCITVACDICKYKYDEDEYVAHFTSLDEARKTLAGTGWTITADRKVFCPSSDTEHQAALDALMPPEPTIQTPGQIAIDAEDTA